MATKKLYLSVKLAERAINDKEMLEALAVALLIKRMDVRSILKDATVRKLKETLKVGTNRAKRILDNEVGFVKRDRVIFCILEKDKWGNLRANKIRAERAYKHNFIFEFEEGVNYSVSNVMDMIRSFVLANRIKQQEYIADTVEKAENPKNMREYRYAKKKLDRMNRKNDETCINGKYSGRTKGFSYNAAMKATNTTRYKAQKLLKGLIAKKAISKQEVIESTAIPAKEFDKNFDANFRKYGYSGRLFVKGGIVFLQLANIYSYVGDFII